MSDSIDFNDANNLNEIGNKLIELLHLEVKENGRVDTTWGDKTPIGLAKTVQRIVSEKV